MKKIFTIFVIILLIPILLYMLAYFSTYHPGDIETEEISCSDSAPTLKAGTKFKVLNWNVQYMAGRKYHFFYSGGEDSKPAKEEIYKTLDEVARVIRDENPDMVLLQEVDAPNSRSHDIDEIKELLSRIDKSYACHTSSYYWKAGFVPHPKIMGSAGMKLVTISKYKIENAVRYKLPQITSQDTLTKLFYIKRAMLEVSVPVENGKPLVLMNTHLSAFAQGDNTMELQTKRIDELLSARNSKPWIISGDFNLLATKDNYDRLNEREKSYYNETSELNLLSQKYKMIPSLKNLVSKDKEKWYTAMTDKPGVTKAERGIDYIFYQKNLSLIDSKIRQGDTAHISDHLPVIASFEIPAN